MSRVIGGARPWNESEARVGQRHTPRPPTSALIDAPRQSNFSLRASFFAVNIATAATPDSHQDCRATYMATLDDAAFGAATKVTPKFVSPSDPAAQWTGAMRGPAFFAYSDNYLIDVKVGIIMDVEASRAIRQAEVGASKTMIERTQERFDIKPERLAGDTAYGSGANLNWLIKDKDIAPHIPVIDKSKREDGTFSRTSRSTRTVTCTSARRTRCSRR